MNKVILGLASVLLLSTSVMAQTDCAYAPEQKMIRDAEYIADLADLKGKFLDQKFPCGGSLMQLAIIRGNPSLVHWLMVEGVDLNTDVSLKGYEIPGAPEMVPLISFAARYASGSAFQDIIDFGADIQAKDSNGNDIMWYLERNPVLRNTYMTKGGIEDVMTTNVRIEKAREEYMKSQNK